jgi:hypothetical protein
MINNLKLRYGIWDLGFMFSIVSFVDRPMVWSWLLSKRFSCEKECSELIAIFVASINTARGKE